MKLRLALLSWPLAPPNRKGLEIQDPTGGSNSRDRERSGLPRPVVSAKTARGPILNIRSDGSSTPRLVYNRFPRRPFHTPVRTLRFKSPASLGAKVLTCFARKDSMMTEQFAIPRPRPRIPRNSRRLRFSVGALVILVGLSMTSKGGDRPAATPGARSRRQFASIGTSGRSFRTSVFYATVPTRPSARPSFAWTAFRPRLRPRPREPRPSFLASLTTASSIAGSPRTRLTSRCPRPRLESTSPRPRSGR